MDQLNTQTPADGQTLEARGIVLSALNSTDLATLPPEVQLATMRQFMETLFSRVETLQQNQAVQFAGVHDRLDAVELELPLIQEQGALRIRDLEARMGTEIEEAARIAAEEVAAELQQDVTRKLGALMAHIESQSNELTQMRESKKMADSRLNRAVQDIERLCGNLGPRPAEAVQRPVMETAASPYRSRIAEHIRKAAVEAAPDESNPLLKNQEAGVRSQEVAAAARAATAYPVPSQPQAVAPVEPVYKPKSENAVPGFDDWKRQFMQEGEPLLPTMGQSGKKIKAVICPRCCSERTRPATLTRLDGLFRLTGFFPHRCRSCAHRFYKRGSNADSPQGEDNAHSSTEEAV